MPINKKICGKNWRMRITCAFACVAAAAQLEAATLIIENSDSFDEEITEVYVVPIELSAWGPNRISQPIPAGYYIEIDLDSFGEAICIFDVLIVEDDADEYEFEMDLCRSPILIFNP